MYLQDLIFTLQQFWAEQRLRASSSRSTSRSAPARFTRRRSCACSAPSRGTPRSCSSAAARPTAATARTRTALGAYYQFQVGLKPSPLDVQELYLDSLRAIGLDPGGARHPLRRGRLGVADARRVGPRLGGLVRRHGGHPVHLLPAGRRHRSRCRSPRELTYGARAPRDVPAERRQHVRPASGTSTSRYGQLRQPWEVEYSTYHFEELDAAARVLELSTRYEGECKRLLGAAAARAAGLRVLHEGSHAFNCSTRAARSA